MMQETALTISMKFGMWPYEIKSNTKYVVWMYKESARNIVLGSHKIWIGWLVSAIIRDKVELVCVEYRMVIK